MFIKADNKYNVILTRVLKYDNEYFEIGDVVEIQVDTYANNPIVGKLIRFDEDIVGGIMRFCNIHVDTSDKFSSDIKIYDISRIKTIHKVEK